MRVASVLALLCLTTPTSATTRRPSMTPHSVAFMDGMDDFNLGTMVKGFPGMVKKNWQQFTAGSGKMWQNGKAAGVVKKRIKTAGFSTIEYSELQLIRRSGEDTGKLVQAAFVWLFVPELFPALLYFYPKALPSTYESEAGRDKRFASLARMRTSSCLELLGTLEEQAATRTTGKKGAAAANAVEIAERSLRAGTPSRALAYVQMCAGMPQPSDKGYEAFSKAQKKLAQRKQKKQLPTVTTGVGKVSLLGISQPCLKAGCKMIGNSGPSPGFLRRAALGKHLEQLVTEDNVLLRKGIKSLSRTELLEACLDRGFGSVELSDAQLRARLDAWLGLVYRSPGEALEPHRVRLAAMAACAASSVRNEQESMSVLPRLLYS